MKVNIHGDDLTSENFARVIDILNEDYKELGIRVKNATCYVRFIDEDGDTVEPITNGCAIERTFTFKKTIEINKK